jgi:predicted MFS family arabinose efflux permease
MYFGWRRFTGGLLGLVGGLLVTTVLSPNFPLAFPDNFGLLFLSGVLFTTLIVGPFSLIVEPAEAVDTRRVTLGEQLRRAVGIVKRDHNYGRYLGLRVIVVATDFALPFYTIYARRVLNAADDMAGVYLIGLTLAAVLSNLILGQLGDRHGNRLLMRLVAFSATLPALMALFISRMPDVGLDKSALFTLVFVLQGTHRTTRAIGSNNYVLELAPSIQRVLYLGFANGLVGLAVFMSPLGGLIVDGLGFEPLFISALACGLVAVLLSTRLEEPRLAANSQVAPELKGSHAD